MADDCGWGEEPETETDSKKPSEEGGWGNEPETNDKEINSSSTGGWGDAESSNNPSESYRGRGRGGFNSGYRGDRPSRGGYSRDNDNYNKSKSSSGGWGQQDKEPSNSDSGWGGGQESSGGWGEQSSSAANECGSDSYDKPRESYRGRGRGRGGYDSGSRGGRGDFGRSRGGSSFNESRDSGGGGWGQTNDSGRGSEDTGNGGGGSNTKPETKSGDSGGWGDSGGDGWGGGGNDKAGGGGGSGGGGGWGGGDNDGDGQADDRRKKFKSGHPEGDGGDDAERPEPYRPAEVNLAEEAALQCEGTGENFQKYKEQIVTCLPPGKIEPIEKFEDVINSELLLNNIKAQKYKEMTPIQKWAIPAIMDGKDLIACAQTGSGKTAAFLLPVLQTLFKLQLDSKDPENECQHPYCLIISPTRELANQTYLNSLLLCKDSFVKSVVIYGQIATGHLKDKLAQGCHILVATPGRLKDFVNRGWIGFKNIKYVILDEGDRLVDEGFSGDIREFLTSPTMPDTLQRQTLFFSATFKAQTQMNAKKYLKDDFIFLTVGRVGAANEDIKQEFLKVSRQDKKRELKRILSEIPEEEKTIIFTQTKAIADVLAGFFTALNLSATSIHGDRHQSQREQAIKAFRRGEKRFLISSPVGNRGLDLPKVSMVINYDLPNNVDEYVHRIGRTGRAGHSGRAISFYDEERDYEILGELKSILQGAKQEIPEWMGDVESAPIDDVMMGEEDANQDQPAMGEETSAANESIAVDSLEEAW